MTTINILPSTVTTDERYSGSGIFRRSMPNKVYPTDKSKHVFFCEFSHRCEFENYSAKTSMS